MYFSDDFQPSSGPAKLPKTNPNLAMNNGDRVLTIDEMDGPVTWRKNSRNSDVAMHQGYE